MGNTETLLPSRGGGVPAATRGWPQPIGPTGSDWGGPWPGMGHPLHSALSFFCLIFFFSTEEMLCLPPAQVPGAAGGAGASPAVDGCVGWSRLLWGSSPAPTRGVSWEPARHHPTQPAPGVPVGTGAMGDDGKHDGSQGHGRDTAMLHGLNCCRCIKKWGRCGLTAPRLGSQRPTPTPGHPHPGVF